MRIAPKRAQSVLDRVDRRSDESDDQSITVTLDAVVRITSIQPLSGFKVFITM
jgi:hypothetical protein